MALRWVTKSHRDPGRGNGGHPDSKPGDRRTHFYIRTDRDLMTATLSRQDGQAGLLHTTRRELERYLTAR